jgi:hypothetical protein
MKLDLKYLKYAVVTGLISFSRGSDALTVCNSAFCIYGFRMVLTVNSDYFLKQHYQVDLCNGEVLCFL